MSEAARHPFTLDPSKKERITSPLLLPLILIVFALICFMTSYYMNGNSSKKLDSYISVDGGIIGPIEVKKNNTVYELTTDIDTIDGKWAYVSIELLDYNKNYLFSFGKEVWSASGYEGGYSWYESDRNITSKITIKKKGAYYLKLAIENKVGANQYANVTLTKKRGSSLPHLIAGILALILGVVFYHLRSERQSVKKFYKKLSTPLIFILMFGFMIWLETL